MSKQFTDVVEARLSELKQLVSSRPVPEDAVVRAKELMDRAIADAPDDPSGIFARYLRARAMEDGILSVESMDSVLEDYQYVMNHSADLRSEGMISYARLLCWKNEQANAAEALSLCAEAARLDSNPRAMMLAGYISDHAMHDMEQAANWYLRAFRSGLPWGLRFYATVQFKRRKYLVAAGAHLAATLASPFLVLRHGKSDPFRL